MDLAQFHNFSTALDPYFTSFGVAAIILLVASFAAMGILGVKYRGKSRAEKDVSDKYLCIFGLIPACIAAVGFMISGTLLETAADEHREEIFIEAAQESYSAKPGATYETVTRLLEDRDTSNSAKIDFFIEGKLIPVTIKSIDNHWLAFDADGNEIPKAARK